MSDPYKDVTLVRLTEYEIVNLKQILRLTMAGGPFPMDTGYWHGQLHYKLAEIPTTIEPLLPDEEMVRLVLFKLMERQRESQ